MDSIYKKIYLTEGYYSGTLYSVHKIVVDIVNEFIRKRSLDKCKILDIGCGDCSLLKLLNENRNYNIDCYGIDIVDRSKYIQNRQHFHKIDISNEKSLYDNNVFDIVISTEVIEHVLDPNRLLSEAHRVLRDDGIFILSTPNLASLGRRILLLLNKNPYIECSPNDISSSGHIRYFVFETLLKMVNKHKFELIQYTSDVVNFDAKDTLKSRYLAKLLPSLGRTLIFVVSKMNE